MTQTLHRVILRHIQIVTIMPIVSAVGLSMHINWEIRCFGYVKTLIITYMKANIVITFAFRS